MKKLEGVKVTSRCGRKSGPRQEVGKIDIEQFESIGEAVQFLGSEEKVLDLINTQFATNAKNDARRVANVSVSDRKVREMAVTKLTSSMEMLQELITRTAATDGSDLAKTAVREDMLASLEAKIREELEAKKGVAGADAEVEDEENND
jgi:uncharacterized protein with von Willebrand factor type A (vWA) domain